MNITTFDDKQAIAIWFGEYLLKKSELSDKLLIALSGGSTPKVIFDELANNFSTKIEWKKIHFYWVDERIVPPTNEESNYKMTVDHLLSKIDIPEENIHRIKGELDAQQACYDYEDEILGQLPNANNLPCFDILLLGMTVVTHT